MPTPEEQGQAQAQGYQCCTDMRMRMRMFGGQAEQAAAAIQGRRQGQGDVLEMCGCGWAGTIELS